MNERETFLAERRSGIGGSDVPAVLGISPFATPLDVWRDKVLGPDDFDSPRMRWGRLLEPLVRSEAAAALGLQVEGPSTFKQDWRIGHVDGIVRDPELGDAVLECKTGERSEDWGAEGTDDIPDHYQAQVQWYLGLTGLRRAIVATLFGGSDFRLYNVQRDDGVIERIGVVAEQFWRVHVLTETPPVPVNLEDCKKRWRAEIVGKSKPAAPVLEILERREARRLQIRALQDEGERDDVLLRCYMEDAEALVDDRGSPLFTLKVQRRAGYVVEPTEYRVARLTKWWPRRQIAEAKTKES